MKAIFILFALFALASSLGMDYSMTLKIIDKGTQILYPAWPVNLECGFWEIEPNTVYKGQSGISQARDKLGLCGSNLQVAYHAHTGKQVLKLKAITGFNQQNKFSFQADQKFNINYKMKCGGTISQNAVVKQGHPCQIEVYLSYKDVTKKAEEL